MKIRTYISIFAFLAIVASCSKGFESHQLSPYTSSRFLYSDEMHDTIRFITFDSWKVDALDKWIAVDGQNSMNIVYNEMKQYDIRVPLNVEPNSGTRTRIGYVKVNSYEYEFTSPVIQLGILDIRHPQPMVYSYLDRRTGIPDSISVRLRDDKGKATTNYSEFNVKNQWQLTVVDGNDPTWLTLEKTEGPTGLNKVNLSMTDNDKTDERSALLRLVSGKAHTDIIITQAPVPVNEDE